MLFYTAKRKKKPTAQNIKLLVVKWPMITQPIKIFFSIACPLGCHLIFAAFSIHFDSAIILHRQLFMFLSLCTIKGFMTSALSFLYPFPLLSALHKSDLHWGFFHYEAKNTIICVLSLRSLLLSKPLKCVSLPIPSKIQANKKKNLPKAVIIISLESRNAWERLQDKYCQLTDNFIWGGILICIKETSKISERLYHKTRFKKNTVLLLFVVVYWLI